MKRPVKKEIPIQPEDNFNDGFRTAIAALPSVEEIEKILNKHIIYSVYPEENNVIRQVAQAIHKRIRGDR